MENPINMDDLGGPPLFLETPLSHYTRKAHLLNLNPFSIPSWWHWQSLWQLPWHCFVLLLSPPCSTDALNRFIVCCCAIHISPGYVETLASSSGCFWNTLSISSIALHAMSIITCYAKVNTSPECLQHHTITSNLFGQVTVAPFTLPFASAVATACAATGTESTHKIWVLKKESREVIKGLRYLHAVPKIHVAGWQGVSLHWSANIGMWRSPCMWRLPCLWLPHKPVRNIKKHSTMPKHSNFEIKRLQQSRLSRFLGFNSSSLKS